jgi:hypothetical protein
MKSGCYTLVRVEYSLNNPLEPAAPRWQPSARTVRMASIAVLLFLFTLWLRVAAMDGPLGGFDNDQFVHLSRAQQMLLGDLPVRDFPEPGLPLTEAASALAQRVFGRTLLTEAVFTSAMLGLSAALVFLLTAHLSRSSFIALIAATAQIAMMPRFYNYPKVLVYGIGLWALWAYVDRPSRSRLVAVAGAIAVAFLFRHDHAVYLSAGAAAAVVLTSWPRVRPAVVHASSLAGLVLAFLSPYIVFVELHGGLVAYFRTATAIAARDTERTGFHVPLFVVNTKERLVHLAPERRKVAMVSIRWRTGLTVSERVAHEHTLHVTPQDQASPDVWRYVLGVSTPASLEAIVRDPSVADTQGIDRERFVLNDEQYVRTPSRLERAVSTVARLRVAPGLVNEDNAVPWLYYLFLATPVVALVLLVLPSRRAASVAGETAKVAVLVVITLLVIAGMLRGNLSSRLADVTTPVGILAGWVTATSLRRAHGRLRTALLTVLLGMALMTFLSAEALERVHAQVESLGMQYGVRGVRVRLSATRAWLSGQPPVAAWPADMEGISRLGRYVAACTRPDDRVLTLAYVPELFFISARGFAGGLVWMMPGFLDGASDQERMLRQLESQHVPIVIADAEPAYSEDYRPSFPIITKWVDEHYVQVGVPELGTGARYAVFAKRDLTPVRTDGSTGLPCFAR